MNGDLPSDIEQFIVQYIDSTEQLEVLLVVAAQPERVWTAEAVYDRVKTNRDSIAGHLQEFNHWGFLELIPKSPPAYRFAPKNREWVEILRRLAPLYQQQMHRVIKVIYSRPSAAIRSFANAFRLRKD